MTTTNDVNDTFCPADYYEAAFEALAAGTMAKIAKEVAEEKAAEAKAAAEAPKAEPVEAPAVFSLWVLFMGS